ncbi:MAG TPA: DUF1998 domain-containing protein, partial [Chloroflexota bacterium]|nr:DUF1998 domain-containing protein [Chloroflexota bacterium]
RLGAEALQSGLLGLTHLLGNVAPLFLMCDPRDLVAVPQVKNPFTGKPTIFLCDNYPGGVGLAGKLYSSHAQVLEAARRLAEDCACTGGCPSCVGPPAEAGYGAKQHALTLISAGLGLVPPTTNAPPLPWRGEGAEPPQRNAPPLPWRGEGARG